MWPNKWRATVTVGGVTATGLSRPFLPLRTLTDWAYQDCPDLKLSNRPVRTLMPGGVAGVPLVMDDPYADTQNLCK